MSAVAIVSVAALCAGYLWVERRTVQRLATGRRSLRRGRGVLSWEGSLAASHDSLEQALERTVEAADVVWTMHDRLFTRGSPRESPFEVRRARVNGSWRGLIVATERLRRVTEAWLSQENIGALSQERLAVERVASWLDEQQLGPRWARGDDLRVSMDVAVDVLENALLNLRSTPTTQGETDPFRALAESAPRASLRQDVARTLVASTRRRDITTTPSPML